MSFLSLTVVTGSLFAFTTFQSGSIKGKIIPPDGAAQVWAMSPSDTLKATVNQGTFELTNAKAGTYKVYIDATEPYKDLVKEGVQVVDGAAVDLGDIPLQK